jgi:hypothetical protein
MKHRTDSALSGRGTRRHIAPQSPAASPPAATPSRAEGTSAPRGLKDKITWVAIGDLKPFPGNPRRHPEDQIAGLMQSIDRVWTNPILIDETRTILAGHARLEAAKRLGRSEVPTLTIAGLTEAEKRAVVRRQSSAGTGSLGLRAAARALQGADRTRLRCRADRFLDRRDRPGAGRQAGAGSNRSGRRSDRAR